MRSHHINLTDCSILNLSAGRTCLGKMSQADLGSRQTSDSSPSDKRGDYWVRFEEEKSWHRYHVEARKDFFGDDTRPLPPGGPIQADLDDVRITHCTFLDSREEVYRDFRDVCASGHRVRTHSAPRRKPLTTDKPSEGKEVVAYPQSSKRQERPYTGTGKPNSISSDDWRAMSLMARRIYVNTERELELEKSRSDSGGGCPGASHIS